MNIMAIVKLITSAPLVDSQQQVLIDFDSYTKWKVTYVLLTLNRLLSFNAMFYIGRSHKTVEKSFPPSAETTEMKVFQCRPHFFAALFRTVFFSRASLLKSQGRHSKGNANKSDMKIHLKSALLSCRGSHKG